MQNKHVNTLTLNNNISIIQISILSKKKGLVNTLGTLFSERMLRDMLYNKIKVSSLQIGEPEKRTGSYNDMQIYNIRMLAKVNSEENENFYQFEFVFGEFYFNSKVRELKYKSNPPIKLSPKENKLLELLVLNINDLLTRDIALNKIWRDDTYFTSRSMDVYIAKLRKYLSLDSSIEIINIHGEGFRLLVK